MWAVELKDHGLDFTVIMFSPVFRWEFGIPRSESYGSGCAGFQFTQTSKELGFTLNWDFGTRVALQAVSQFQGPGIGIWELWAGMFGASGRYPSNGLKMSSSAESLPTLGIMAPPYVVAGLGL